MRWNDDALNTARAITDIGPLIVHFTVILVALSCPDVRHAFLVPYSKLREELGAIGGVSYLPVETLCILPPDKTPHGLAHSAPGAAPPTLHLLCGHGHLASAAVGAAGEADAELKLGLSSRLWVSTQESAHRWHHSAGAPDSWCHLGPREAQLCAETSFPLSAPDSCSSAVPSRLGTHLCQGWSSSLFISSTCCWSHF